MTFGTSKSRLDGFNSGGWKGNYLEDMLVALSTESAEDDTDLACAFGLLNCASSHFLHETKIIGL